MPKFSHSKSSKYRVASAAIMIAAVLGTTPTRSHDMAAMEGHMLMTTLKPSQPGDQAKADAVVSTAKRAMAPYQDYRKALADGYKIFLPEIPQPQYHFTNYRAAWEARSHFDAAKPTSLI
jgi:hypothetical protein